MSPAMAIEEDKTTKISQYQKGVKHLYDNGITKVPTKYILPESDRPNATNENPNVALNNLIKLPVIDYEELQGSNRAQALKSLANACEQYGFFQLVNHGISSDIIRSMKEVSENFFELPIEERGKYMSSDMRAPVRYGTSFNQNKDEVFCWRDFLKLMCHPLPDFLPHWPSSPVNFRKMAATYAEETKKLFVKLVEAILESLGIMETNKKKEMEEEEDDNDNMILKQLEDGSQLMVVNCYPPCPEPELTLGMPPHSDYGFLTLLLQDQVQGLQIHFRDQWVTLQPLADSFVVNVGDHLEIFSNGRYKSVLHRVVVNSNKYRISVASLHSLPLTSTVGPSAKLIDEANPRRYKDTDYESFIEYVSTCEPKKKNFLESRKLSL